jgi:uncharacterized protein (DUF1684 family)
MGRQRSGFRLGSSMLSASPAADRVHLLQRAAVGVLVIGLTSSGGAARGADEAYRRAIEAWRAQREASLKADDGWLTLVGLFWLREGENRIGSDPTNDFIVAEPAPPQIGTFLYRNGQVTFRAAEGVRVTLNGRVVTETPPLRIGPADTLAVGTLSMFVHPSGDRLAIRVRDLNSPFRRHFAGLKWFPIDENYRVTGRFIPYPSTSPQKIPNILGDYEVYTPAGEVEFRLEGRTFRIQVFESGPDRLFIVFRDLTSGKESYPTARFLYADRPKETDGLVELDFNKAYNPPCAYNPHTTCPLPPRQNRLSVRIPAGEMNYHPGT